MFLVSEFLYLSNKSITQIHVVFIKIRRVVFYTLGLLNYMQYSIIRQYTSRCRCVMHFSQPLLYCLEMSPLPRYKIHGRILSMSNSHHMYSRKRPIFQFQIILVTFTWSELFLDVNCLIANFVLYNLKQISALYLYQIRRYGSFGKPLLKIPKSPWDSAVYSTLGLKGLKNLN